MQIKRFEAKNMTTALQLIKSELGPEAVILSARTLKKENKIFGLVRSVGVEVTAAIDTYHLSTSSNSIPNASVLANCVRNEPIGRSRKKIFRPVVAGKIKSPARRQRSKRSINGVKASNKDPLADLFQHLVSQGVNRDIAHDLVDAIKKPDQNADFDSKDQIIAEITDLLEQKRNGREPLEGTNAHPRVLAFIGPTGVGKTTTAAKLAAQHAIERNQKVVLISLDCDRVGAFEALKVYGKAIGIPVIPAATPSAFKTAIHQHRQYDLVLVDTPGFNAAKQNEIVDLKSFLEVIHSIEIHLLLSAGAKETDLINTFKRLKTIAVEYLIFTKLDESCTYGNLINLLVDTRLPLSFLTTGRQVPKSIENGTLQKIVQYLLGSYKTPAVLPNSGRQNQSYLESSSDSTDTCFVANKKSDVFHCPDCKWTKNIKPKNMLTFSSVQEAKIQHFMPCRDCQPAQVDRCQTGLLTGDRIRISSYL